MWIILLMVLRVAKLVMDFEVRDGHNLKQRFAVEVNVFKAGVLLIIDIRVGEAESRYEYPLETIRPFDCSCSFLFKFTPWTRMISPHFRVFC